MNLLPEPLERRVRHRCQSHMQGLFLRRSVLEAGHDHVHGAALRHGVSDVCIIKVRRDTKVIARGVHPEWGAVAVKAFDPIASSIHAHSARHTDQLVTEHPAPFLPRVLASGPGYSISEWIEGRRVLQLEPQEAERVAFEQFVDGVVRWASGFGDGSVLVRAEVLSIVRFYVETTVRRMNYHSGSRCLAASCTFAMRQAAVGRLLEEVGELAGQLTLPRTLMFSDVHAGNLVVDDATGRIMMVDYEALRPGNHLFDVVFCLASLMIHELPTRATERLADHVFSAAHIPPGLTATFFRRLAEYVVTTYMIIDGRPRRRIEATVDIIRSAGAQADA